MSILAAVLALFYYIQVPVVDMHQQPAAEAEIESQALFAEPIQLIEERGDWAQIEVACDKAQGWVLKNSLYAREEAFTPHLRVHRLAAHLYNKQDTIYGPLLTLPFESRLELIQKIDSRWLRVGLPNGQTGYIQQGDVEPFPAPLTREEICAFSQRFLGLPYTWGGRSSFGYDCSGFVQMLYRQMGISLPRNSKDQMKWEGFKAIDFADLQKGDLIFFGLAADKIRHVGLYLGEDKFIHATVAENAPYIHISQLSDPEWSGAGKFSYRAARTLEKIAELH